MCKGVTYAKAMRCWSFPLRRNLEKNVSANIVRAVELAQKVGAKITGIVGVTEATQRKLRMRLW